MKKLFFLAMVTLHTTLTFASAALPWTPGNPQQNVTITSMPSNPSPIDSKSSSSTSSSSASSASKVLTDGNGNVAVQNAAIFALLQIAEQQNRLRKPAQARRKYDESHLQPTAQAIENWNKLGTSSKKLAELSTTKVAQKEMLATRAIAGQEVKTDTCVQILTALKACGGENEAFWKLRNFYIDSGCEEPVDNCPEFSENVCYSVPFGATEAYYLAGIGSGGAVIATEYAAGMVCTAFSGSAVASAFVAAAPPIIMCAIVYTGGKFLVNLIKNYQEEKHKTTEMKAVEKAAERYACDFQYALDRTLHIGTVNAIPTNPLYYAMCYGYENDPYAKVITIVDKQHKQHIFVVPDGLSKSVFQISDGSKQAEPFISFRYLVPQATIDAIESKRKGSNKKPDDDDDDAPRYYEKSPKHPDYKTIAQAEQYLAKGMSPSPQKGQAVLNVSIKTGDGARAATENGYIVIFYRTRRLPEGGSIYHGFISTYKNMKQRPHTAETINILKKTNLITNSGKIK